MAVDRYVFQSDPFRLRVLDFVRKEVYASISGFALQTMELYQVPRVTDEMVFGLSARIAGEVLIPKDNKDLEIPFEETVSFELESKVDIPSSWWQHFKEDCFPKWALELWPVKMRSITRKELKHFMVKGKKRVNIRVLATYPKYEENFGSPVTFLDDEKISEDPTKGTCVLEIKEIFEYKG